MTLDPRGRRAAQALLQAAEGLGPAPDLARLRRRRRRRAARRAGLAALAVTVAAAVLWQALAPSGGPDGTRPLALPGVPGLDGHVRDAIPTGRAAGTDLVAGPDAVWVLNRSRPPDQDQLVRVDPATDRVVARIPVGRGALRVAVGDGSVWVLRATSGRVDLVQVDPATNRVVKTSPPLGATSRRDRGVTERLLVAGRVVWAVTGAGVLRYDPAAGAVVEVAGPDRVGPLSGLAVAGGSIWVVSGMVVFKLRPGDGTVLQSDAPKELTPMIPSGLAAGAGSLWVAGSGRLARLDAVTGRVAAVFRAGPGVATVAGDRRNVVGAGGKALYLIDPAANRVRAAVPLPQLGAVAVGGGAVWVTDEPRGRLLRVDPGP